MAVKAPNWKKDIDIKYHLIGYVVLCKDYIRCSDSDCPFKHYWAFNCHDRESFARCYIEKHGSIDGFEESVLEKARKKLKYKGVIGFSGMKTWIDVDQL